MEVAQEVKPFVDGLLDDTNAGVIEGVYGAQYGAFSGADIAFDVQAGVRGRVGCMDV